MDVVDFKTSGYFSWTIIFLGIIFLFVGISVLLSKPIVGLILLLVSVMIFTTHYRLEIDFDKKIFHHYAWIAGIKQGEKGHFENLEYLFIKKSKVSQRMNHVVGSATLHKVVYHGYLKISEKEKIHLATSENKTDLIKKLNRTGSKLNLKIVDYSIDDDQAIVNGSTLPYLISIRDPAF